MILEGFMEFSCETMWELVLSSEELFHYFLYSSFHESCSTSVLYLCCIFQLLSCVQLFVTLWTAAFQSSLSFTISQFAQTHVHWAGDASNHLILYHHLLALNLSQHQGLFQWVGTSHQDVQSTGASISASVAKVLELQLLHQSLQWIFRVDFL